jgi:hypothetical protein
MMNARNDAMEAKWRTYESARQSKRLELEAKRAARKEVEAKARHLDYYDGIQWERATGADEADQSAKRLEDIISERRRRPQ